MCDKRKENSLKLTIIFYVYGNYIHTLTNSLNDIQAVYRAF